MHLPVRYAGIQLHLSVLARLFQHERNKNLSEKLNVSGGNVKRNVLQLILKSAEATGVSADFIVNTGDGNRTRVSCLGSTRPTIERRPRGSAQILSCVCVGVKAKMKNKVLVNKVFLMAEK